MPTRTRGGTTRVAEEAIAVRGLTGLQRALRRADTETGKRLRRELRDIAKDVRDTAQTYVTHRTGRHGGADVPRLADSLKVSVTTTGATVFSEAPHAAVQDQGGRVGRNRATLLKRANVSHYMSNAVRDAQPYVTRRLEELMDELERDFER